MQIAIEEFAALVAIYLGEYPAFRYKTAIEGNSVNFQEMVTSVVTPLLEPMTARLSSEQCTHTVDFRDFIHDNTDSGYEHFFPCALPKDFFRMHSLWMPDWGAPLTENSPADPLRDQLGDSAPEWLAARTSRPIYRIVDTGGGFKELWYGPTKYRMPRQAAYIPRPHYDRNSGTIIDLQPMLLDPLAAKTAEIIADTKY